ncbi:MAG TPA: hypothetical protein VKU00_12115 [Chthonomonadaceae bacterium]|nr:hypothetical protein [Chthonomonadaceae bacterium]
MNRSHWASLGLVCVGLLSLLARSEAQAPNAQAALQKPTPNAKSAAHTEGIHWLTSFEKAKQKALRENKPVLLFQLFGKLDEALC